MILNQIAYSDELRFLQLSNEQLIIEVNSKIILPTIIANFDSNGNQI
jgi:sulfur carrier protein ThiS